jgi:TolB-like protein
VHEVDPERGFIAMELIEGESLAAKLGGRPLPVEKAVSLAVQICEGLAAAHAKGVIHRDIKSANLLVTAEGQVKILDFGLARVAGQAGLTRQGAAAGTPGYMAPEQMRGEPVDRRTDIWAVGAVLHEMLTGRPPVGEIKTLPEGLSRIVRKALAADPGDRYQHIEDLLVDLRAAATPPAVPAVPRRWLWPVAAAVVVLAVTGGWFWRGRTSAPSRRSTAIAVLYFRNLSQDRALDWLDSGLCEMLTTNLSQVKGMDVLSTERIASVLGRLGKKQMSAEVAPEVARDAGAGAFVTGALMRIGQSRLRLDVRAQDSASR